MTATTSLTVETFALGLEGVRVLRLPSPRRLRRRIRVCVLPSSHMLHWSSTSIPPFGLSTGTHAQKQILPQFSSEPYRSKPGHHSFQGDRFVLLLDLCSLPQVLVCHAPLLLPETANRPGACRPQDGGFRQIRCSMCESMGFPSLRPRIPPPIFKRALQASRKNEQGLSTKVFYSVFFCPPSLSFPELLILFNAVIVVVVDDRVVAGRNFIGTYWRDWSWIFRCSRFNWHG